MNAVRNVSDVYRDGFPTTHKMKPTWHNIRNQW
jgi:hypothetical protein